MNKHQPAKPLVFLGQRFESQEDFGREYPAYRGYAREVVAGADTPMKVEKVIYERMRKARAGSIRAAREYNAKRAAKKKPSQSLRKATRARMGEKA